LYLREVFVALLRRYEIVTKHPLKIPYVVAKLLN